MHTEKPREFEIKIYIHKILQSMLITLKHYVIVVIYFKIKQKKEKKIDKSIVKKA